MKLEAEHLELLRELVREEHKSARFPAERVAQRRVARRPWILNELLETGLVSNSSGHIVVTLDGLREAHTEESRRDLDTVEQVLRELQEVEEAFPGKQHALKDLQDKLPGMSSVDLSMALTRLALTRGISSTYNTDGATGFVKSLRLKEGALEGTPAIEASDGTASVGNGTFSVFARDFRGLSRVQWSPSGVCLVAGPNGSGKTSLLSLVQILRDSLLIDLNEAVKLQLGPAGLRRLGAGGPPEVTVGCSVDAAVWELRLQLEGGALDERPGERVQVGDEFLVRRAPFSSDLYVDGQRWSVPRERRTGLRILWENKQPSSLLALVEALSSYESYSSYSLGPLRDGGRGGETDAVLDPTGHNLFLVLRNWRAAPRKFENRFAWVMTHLRRAFDGLVEDIEFDPPVGQVVPARFYVPGGRGWLPMSRAADGLLVGLLHLTAVAGAPEGGIVAIDEMENQLHPYAIRSLLASMRELAEERRLTVLLTTHSPVLMNEFREHPEKLYVMEPGRETLPVPLTELHDPEWLAHFSLGDLYDRLEFGAPRVQEG